MASGSGKEVGYYVVPVILSFRDTGAQADKELGDRLKAAAKKHGQDYSKTFQDEAFGKKSSTSSASRQAHTEMGTTLSRSGKAHGQQYGKELRAGVQQELQAKPIVPKIDTKTPMEQLQNEVGKRLGEIVGRKIGEAIGNSPVGDFARGLGDKVQPVVEVVRTVGDGLRALNERDVPAFVKSIQGLGVPDDVASSISTTATSVQNLSGPIKDIASGDKATKIKGIADGLSAMAPAVKDLTGYDLGPTVEKVTLLGVAAAGIKELGGAFAGLKVAALAIGGGSVIEALGIFAAAATPLAAIAWGLNWAHGPADLTKLPVGALPNTPQVPGQEPKPGLLPSPGTPGALPPGYEVGPGGIPIKKKAGGGPIGYGFGGQKGVDSVPVLAAPDEHMWATDEVDGAGGHGVVARLRAMAKAGVFKGMDKGGKVGAGRPGLNTAGAQVDTIAIAEAVQQQFGVNNIGMYRAADKFPEHPSGEAADVMVGLDNKVGYDIKDYALHNSALYDVLYCIWQQAMWYPDGRRVPMEDRGSPTENHRDHVHIRTAGGGYPKGGRPDGAPSPAGTKTTPAPGVGGGIPGLSAAGAGGVSGDLGGALSSLSSGGGGAGGGGGDLGSLLGGGGGGGSGLSGILGNFLPSSFGSGPSMTGAPSPQDLVGLGIGGLKESLTPAGFPDIENLAPVKMGATLLKFFLPLMQGLGQGKLMLNPSGGVPLLVPATGGAAGGAGGAGGFGIPSLTAPDMPSGLPGAAGLGGDAPGGRPIHIDASQNFNNSPLGWDPAKVDANHTKNIMERALPRIPADT